MSISRKSAGLAASAAFLAISGLAQAATPPAGSTGPALSASDTVHCYGINGCKGQADCATANHECKGMNECKGQGFKALAAGECLSNGGVIADLN